MALNITKSEAVELQMTFTTEIFNMPKTTVKNTASFDMQRVPQPGGEELQPHFPTLWGSKLSVSWESSYSSYILGVSKNTEQQLQPITLHYYGTTLWYPLTWDTVCTRIKEKSASE